jgi:hypothetical protein
METDGLFYEAEFPTVAAVGEECAAQPFLRPFLIPRGLGFNK